MLIGIHYMWGVSDGGTLELQENFPIGQSNCVQCWSCVYIYIYINFLSSPIMLKMMLA